MYLLILGLASVLNLDSTDIPPKSGPSCQVIHEEKTEAACYKHIGKGSDRASCDTPSEAKLIEYPILNDLQSSCEHPTHSQLIDVS
jgi:hypothetical protein